MQQAREASAAWSSVPLAARLEKLAALRLLIVSRREEILLAITQDAGKVRARRGDGTVVEMPVKGVTYIFDSKAGARANRSVLDRYGFGILYRDDQGQLLQLDEG